MSLESYYIYLSLFFYTLTPGIYATSCRFRKPSCTFVLQPACAGSKKKQNSLPQNYIRFFLFPVTPKTDDLSPYPYH
jgi:hypothetical protein